MSDAEQQQSELRHFAEDVGLIFERMSMPRMTGRVVGWLLVCDPPHQSMNELVEALQTSKSSISTTTRLLEEIYFIQRIRLPGYRHDHYRLIPGAWNTITKARLAQVSTIRTLAERGLNLLNHSSPEGRERLQEMHDIYAFWEQEIPGLISRWEEEQAQSKIQTP